MVDPATRICGLTVQQITGLKNFYMKWTGKDPSKEDFQYDPLDSVMTLQGARLKQLEVENLAMRHQVEWMMIDAVNFMGRVRENWEYLNPNNYDSKSATWKAHEDLGVRAEAVEKFLLTQTPHTAALQEYMQALEAVAFDSYEWLLSTAEESDHHPEWQQWSALFKELESARKAAGR